MPNYLKGKRSNEFTDKAGEKIDASTSHNESASGQDHLDVDLAPLLGEEMKHHLSPIYEDLSKDDLLERCLGDHTQNANEKHVWQVIVKKRGLGASRNISGRYHLCLNDNTLSLVRIGGGSNSNSTTNTNAAFNETATNQHPPLQHRASSQSIQPQPEELIEFPLIYIKSTGALESFFYMEVGRSAVTGAGELWMLSDDPNIAQNMNSIIQS
ncbi:uncharacterized protein LOC113365508 [Ctenocephalides felis]|uniref:uncharacterized protein LOC113365508 n=1 Tax=Ctenocephalides felis TaxID=7515 RepID=UPI000E6E56AB|nr:uncharacterized protein LOC113365508 [Ctenocephalides felis]